MGYLRRFSFLALVTLCALGVDRFQSPSRAEIAGLSGGHRSGDTWTHSSKRGAMAPDPRRSVVLPFPATVPGLVRAVTRASAFARSAVGLEVVPSTPHDPSAAPADGQCDVTGMPLPEALPRLANAASGYAFRSAGPVPHILPAAFADNPDVALSRRLSHFDLDSSDLQDTLAAVHGVLNFSPGKSLAHGQRPDRVRPFFEKPIKLSLSDVTVRTVLDEIALQHSAILWVAEYADRNGAAAGMRLSFVGFDNWSASKVVGQPVGR